MNGPPPGEELKALGLIGKKKDAPRPEVDPDKESYTVTEAAILMDVSEKDVYDLIRSGELEAQKYGNKLRVRREEIDWWLVRQRLRAESKEGE